MLVGDLRAEVRVILKKVIFVRALKENRGDRSLNYGTRECALKHGYCDVAISKY